jgi:hypothetical protein
MLDPDWMAAALEMWPAADAMVMGSSARIDHRLVHPHLARALAIASRICSCPGR